MCACMCACMCAYVCTCVYGSGTGPKRLSPTDCPWLPSPPPLTPPRTGTCVPVCLAAFLLRYLGLHTTKVVFVESVCRTEGLSITGRVLYLLADRFLVQWPALQTRFPLSEYIGLLM